MEWALPASIEVLLSELAVEDPVIERFFICERIMLSSMLCVKGILWSETLPDGSPGRLVIE